MFLFCLVVCKNSIRKYLTNCIILGFFLNNIHIILDICNINGRICCKELPNTKSSTFVSFSSFSSSTKYRIQHKLAIMKSQLQQNLKSIDFLAFRLCFANL